MGGMSEEKWGPCPCGCGGRVLDEASSPPTASEPEGRTEKAFMRCDGCGTALYGRFAIGLGEMHTNCPQGGAFRLENPLQSLGHATASERSEGEDDTLVDKVLFGSLNSDCMEEAQQKLRARMHFLREFAETSAEKYVSTRGRCRALQKRVDIAEQRVRELEEDCDGPFNAGERLTRDGLPYTDREGASFMGDRPVPATAEAEDAMRKVVAGHFAKAFERRVKNALKRAREAESRIEKAREAMYRDEEAHTIICKNLRAVLDAARRQPGETSEKPVITDDAHDA